MRIGIIANLLLGQGGVSSSYGAPQRSSCSHPSGSTRPDIAAGPMTRVLSVNSELLRRTLAVLLSPLDFPTSSAWRQAITNHLLTLLAVDSVTTVVRLPGSSLVQTGGNVPEVSSRNTPTTTIRRASWTSSGSVVASARGRALRWWTGPSF